MSLGTEQKAEIVSKFGMTPGDSGSSRVQVALLTKRIDSLQDHFKTHKKDHAGRRGLLKLVGQRRRLLDYIRRENLQGYRTLIQELGIRK